MIKLQNANEIVMVDDSDVDLHLAKRCLARSQLKNEFVGLLSAENLYQYLKEVKDSRKPLPAIVLLDVNMPVVDGHEALKTVRKDDFFKTLPFIAMFSHSTNKFDIEQALQNGANAYKVKPVSLSDFVTFFDSLAAG